MEGIVVAFFVPVVCFLVIVAPIWIIFHYKSKSNVVNGLTASERAELEEMIEVARQSEHPRAYEVLAGLIKDTAATSEKLMDLHRKIQSLDKMMLPAPTQENGNTTNNLFIGSTTELQRMLKDLKEKDVTPED